MKKTPPESYLIFREELLKAKEENRRLKEEYEARLTEFSGELSYLREQISAQQSMIKTTVEYAVRLEEEMETLKGKVQTAADPNRSYH